MTEEKLGCEVGMRGERGQGKRKECESRGKTGRPEGENTRRDQKGRGDTAKTQKNTKTQKRKEPTSTDRLELRIGVGVEHEIDARFCRG